MTIFYYEKLVHVVHVHRHTHDFLKKYLVLSPKCLGAVTLGYEQLNLCLFSPKKREITCEFHHFPYLNSNLQPQVLANQKLEA